MNELQSAAGGDGDLGDLLYDFLEALERSPSSHAQLVDDVCSSRPDLADAFRQSVTELAEAGLLEDVDGAPPEKPKVYGGYRVVKRLGAGGMGVVYLATSIDTGAEVALKIVRPAELLLGGRTRFAREAEAVRKLDHPSIASLISADLESDEPSLAFEYIDGVNLGALIKELVLKRSSELDPSRISKRRSASGNVEAEWARASCELVAQIADALGHAHGRGVLHRDVKPSNVILSEGGRATLVDFGLAALDGAQRLTRSGAELGSLPYMSPEQLTNAHSGLDARSDIYSLGVLLYELIARRQPFLGPDTQATRKHILEGHPVALRERVPGLPIEIQTVCHKALERDRSHRYQEAETFASDLRRAALELPVHARPPGPVRRMRRWAERSPLQALVVAALLVGLLGLPLGYAWLTKRDARRVALVNSRLESALVESRADRARAEEHFAIAREAILGFVASVSSKDLPNTPHLQAVRADILESSRLLYERLNRERASDPNVLRQLLDLTLAHLNSLHDLGSTEECLAALVDFDVLVEELESSGGEPREINEYRARSHYLRALTFTNALRFEEALAAASIAAEQSELAISRGTDGKELRLALAHSLSVAAGGSWNLHRRTESAAFSVRAEKAAIELIERFETAAIFEAASGIFGSLASLSSHAGDGERGIALGRRALELALLAAEGNGEAPRSRFRIAAARDDLSESMRVGGGDLERAAELLVAAREELEVLVRAFPAVDIYPMRLSQVNVRAASLLRAAGDDAGAYEAHQHVLDDALRRLEKAPEDPNTRQRAIIALINGASFARELPLDQAPADVTRARVIGYCDQARAIHGDFPPASGAFLDQMLVRIEYYSASAKARLGRRDAWDDLRRLESVMPQGPLEAQLALDTYHQVLALVDAGVLPEGEIDPLQVSDQIREKVLVCLEQYATSTIGSADELSRLPRLERFAHDERFAALAALLE